VVWQQHIPEVLAVPGFVDAQRFALSRTQRTGAPPGEFGFLAVYGINGPLDAALGGLDAAVARRDALEHGDGPPLPFARLLPAGRARRTMKPAIRPGCLPSVADRPAGTLDRANLYCSDNPMRASPEALV
jgi:hypothetical protein